MVEHLSATHLGSSRLDEVVRGKMGHDVGGHVTGGGRALVIGISLQRLGQGHCVVALVVSEGRVGAAVDDRISGLLDGGGHGDGTGNSIRKQVLQRIGQPISGDIDGDGRSDVGCNRDNSRGSGLRVNTGQGAGLGEGSLVDITLLDGFRLGSQGTVLA